MFGILGVAIAIILFSLSAIANFYNAGKYSRGWIDVRHGTSARNVAIFSAFMDIIIVALLILF